MSVYEITPSKLPISVTLSLIFATGKATVSFTDKEGRILVAAYLVRSDKTNLARNEIQANEAGEISCSFTFTQVGTWKITYLVFDAAYNITLQEVTVIVEA